MVKKYFVFLGTTIIVFLIDQTTKYWLYQSPKVSLIPNFLEIWFTTNRGIAFSIPFEGLWLILFTTALVISGVLFVPKYFDVQKIPSQLVFGAILGGALGNLWDRILRGYVIDFIRLWWIPVFNVADMAIFMGAVALILFYGHLELKK